MSATLFSYDDPTDVDCGMTLDVDVHNHLTMYVCEPNHQVSMTFFPDDAGLDTVEKFANALQEWVRHVKED